MIVVVTRDHPSPVPSLQNSYLLPLFLFLSRQTTCLKRQIGVKQKPLLLPHTVALLVILSAWLRVSMDTGTARVKKGGYTVGGGVGALF